MRRRYYRYLLSDGKTAHLRANTPSFQLEIPDGAARSRREANIDGLTDQMFVFHRLRTDPPRHLVVSTVARPEPGAEPAASLVYQVPNGRRSDFRTGPRSALHVSRPLSWRTRA